MALPVPKAGDAKHNKSHPPGNAQLKGVRYPSPI